LWHIARIVEDDQPLNHGCGEKTHRCQSGLPGEEGNPALDPAEKGTQLRRGMLSRPVILRAGDGGAEDATRLFSLPLDQQDWNKIRTDMDAISASDAPIASVPPTETMKP